MLKHGRILGYTIGISVFFVIYLGNFFWLLWGGYWCYCGTDNWYRGSQKAEHHLGVYNRLHNDDNMLCVSLYAS